jgi:hypothetical protein
VAQDRGQGGGHPRQRHDDDCGSERGWEEIIAKIKVLSDPDFKPLEFDRFRRTFRMAKKIEVRGTEIRILTIAKEDYISLTDMLKAKDGDFFISDWLRNRNTVEFLGIWERVYNPSFNYGEFAIIKSQTGLNSYKISVKEWVEKTNAIGIKATAGRTASQVEPDRHPSNETAYGRPKHQAA